MALVLKRNCFLGAISFELTLQSRYRYQLPHCLETKNKPQKTRPQTGYLPPSKMQKTTIRSLEKHPDILREKSCSSKKRNWRLGISSNIRLFTIPADIWQPESKTATPTYQTISGYENLPDSVWRRFLLANRHSHPIGHFPLDITVFFHKMNRFVRSLFLSPLCVRWCGWSWLQVV